MIFMDESNKAAGKDHAEYEDQCNASQSSQYTE